MEQPAPAYQGNEPYVFVSYSHQDEGLVYREIRWLQDHGINVWYDRQIQAGSEWSEALAKAIRGCSHFLYFITPNSVASEHCRRELNHALEERRSVLAVHFQETDVPGGIRLSLNNRQAIFRYRISPDDYRSALLAGLTAQPTPRIAPKAEPSVTRKLGLVGLGIVLFAFVAAAGWFWRSGRIGTGGQTAHIPTAIAVLPFEDISADGNQRWLATGMSESLTFYLSRVEGLEVKQVPSPADTDPISLASRLGIGTVVSGSVQRVGDSVSITARAVRTRDGARLWSARYDRELEDLLDLQRNVAREVVRAIEAEFGLDDPARAIAIERARYGAADVRAYELYRRAFDIKVPADGSVPREADLRQALEFNREAVAIDPSFSQGWVGLGASHVAMWQIDGDVRDRLEARRAFLRAIALEPDNPVALGNLISIEGGEQRWREVVALAERAESLASLARVGGTLPYYVQSLINLGRWQDLESVISETVWEVRRSPERFPPHLRVHADLALSMILATRDFDGALEQLEQTSARLTSLTWNLPVAGAYRASGRQSEGVAYLRRGVQGEAGVRLQQAFDEEGWDGMLQSLLADAPQRGLECAGLMSIHAELGNSGQLYGCLERMANLSRCFRTRPPEHLGECLEDGVEPIPFFLWTAPSYDRYRDDTRFRALLDETGVIGHRNCCPVARAASSG